MWVWRCCKFCKFASLPSVFSLFLFSVCCFRMGPFLFPFLYARANIIMCLSFSSGVLRYKNILCNTSVIQSITKKFQEIRKIASGYSLAVLAIETLPSISPSTNTTIWSGDFGCFHFKLCKNRRFSMWDSSMFTLTRRQSFPAKIARVK